MVVFVFQLLAKKAEKSPASYLQRSISSGKPGIFSHPWAIAMSSLSSHTGTTLSSGQHQAELNPRCSQARFNRAEPSSCDLFLGNYVGSQRSLLCSEGPGLTPHGWVSHLRASALSHRDQGRQAEEGPSPQRQRPCSLGRGTSLPGSLIPTGVHMSSCPTCTCAHKGRLPGMYPNTHVQTHTDSGTPLPD